MICSNAFETRFEISCSEETLSLIKERRNENINETISEFDRICSVDNDGENNMVIEFIEDAVS
jgi:hypothetical protein